MLEKAYNYRFALCFCFFAFLEVFAIFLAPSWYRNTTTMNTLLFMAVSYYAISQLFGKKHSIWWAILWSILIMGPLRYFFGIIEVILYWILFSKRKTPDPQQHSNTTHSEHQTLTSNRVHACIPILRIPLPWITYSISDKCITRTSWFGEDDPEPISRIENWNLSGTAVRVITGVSCFRFRSKKPHADDYVVWKLIPSHFAEMISQRCTDNIK